MRGEWRTIAVRCCAVVYENQMKRNGLDSWILEFCLVQWLFVLLCVGKTNEVARANGTCRAALPLEACKRHIVSEFVTLHICNVSSELSNLPRRKVSYLLSRTSSMSNECTDLLIAKSRLTRNNELIIPTRDAPICRASDGVTRVIGILLATVCIRLARRTGSSALKQV